MASTATRLITLILLLQRQPGQKAADLAQKLGVSVRTLHRYLGMLDEMGVPVYAERGPYGGFSLVRGYKLPPLVFTPQEAVAVGLGASLVGEMWGQLYHEAAEGALAKLDNVLPDEQRQEIAWARRSLSATGMNRADIAALEPLLHTLRQAIRQEQRVNMRYHSGGGMHGQPRKLDPYALVHRWGWWYVIGYCHRRQALRSFRLDRIASLQSTSEHFSIPAGFDLRAYLQEERQNAPQISVRMRFDARFASLARHGRGYWQSMQEQADGSVEVELTAPDAAWAASTVLAYGPAVTVLHPPEVIAMVQNWAAQTAALYTESQGVSTA